MEERAFVQFPLSKLVRMGSTGEHGSNPFIIDLLHQLHSHSHCTGPTALLSKKYSSAAIPSKRKNKVSNWRTVAVDELR